jgi:hypothetical protein
MGESPFDKLKDLAEEHGDKIEGVVEKLADIVDDKTGHKHSDKIESAVEKAKGFLGSDDSDKTADQEPPSKLTP